MVYSHSWAWQEKNGARAHAGGVGSEAQNVQLPGVERPKDSLQEVRLHNKYIHGVYRNNIIFLYIFITKTLYKSKFKWDILHLCMFTIL